MFCIFSSLLSESANITTSLTTVFLSARLKPEPSNSCFNLSRASVRETGATVEDTASPIVAYTVPPLDTRGVPLTGPFATTLTYFISRDPVVTVTPNATVVGDVLLPTNFPSPTPDSVILFASLNTILVLF